MAKMFVAGPMFLATDKRVASPIPFGPAFHGRTVPPADLCSEKMGQNWYAVTRSVVSGALALSTVLSGCSHGYQLDTGLRAQSAGTSPYANVPPPAPWSATLLGPGTVTCSLPDPDPDPLSFPGSFGNLRLLSSARVSGRLVNVYNAQDRGQYYVVIDQLGNNSRFLRPEYGDLCETKAPVRLAMKVRTNHFEIEGKWTDSAAFLGHAKSLVGQNVKLWFGVVGPWGNPEPWRKEIAIELFAVDEDK